MVEKQGTAYLTSRDHAPPVRDACINYGRHCTRRPPTYAVLATFSKANAFILELWISTELAYKLVQNCQVERQRVWRQSHRRHVQARR